MLTVVEELFGSDDIAEIKSWLKQKGAGLFRRALKEEIAKEQIEASNKMLGGLEPDRARFKEDAERRLRRVVQIQNALDELDRAQSTDFKPFVAKVTTA